MRSLPLLLTFMVLLAGCATSAPLQDGEAAEDAAGAREATDAGGDDAPRDPEADPDPQEDAAASPSHNGTDGGDATVQDPDGNETGPTDNGTAGAEGNSTDPGDGNTTSGDGSGEGNTSSGGGTSDGNETSGGSTQSGNSSDPDEGSGEDPAPETRWVDASVFDNRDGALDTAMSVDVTVPDHTWHADPPTHGNAGPEGMGQFEVGVLHEGGFTVVLDDGATTCTVDLQVTEEMDDSTEADATVEIYNVDVRIFGPAIPGHPDYWSAYVCGR